MSSWPLQLQDWTTILDSHSQYTPSSSSNFEKVIATKSGYKSCASEGMLNIQGSKVRGFNRHLNKLADKQTSGDSSGDCGNRLESSISTRKVYINY